MFENGRRSATSTSELGLYSDRSDRYNRSKYSLALRKFVIAIMAVVAVILAAILIYDFASGASASSKVSQETKHIYILQNALKKPHGVSKRPVSSTTIFPGNETNNATYNIHDRSDSSDPQDLNYVETKEPSAKIVESRSPRTIDGGAEMRSQSLENFKHRQILLDHLDSADESSENPEGKQFNNHAVVYRVRQRFKYPDPEEEFNEEESRPAPFRFELKTPQPSAFNKRPKFPQLTQYRYPHSSRNIQDIIKYLTNDPSTTNRGIKFTGVYVNPKKYDLYPEVGETMANSDRNEYHVGGGHRQDIEEDYEDDEEEERQENPRIVITGNNGDPFYPYKPKHPTDVNLLAPANVRFSPIGTHRYNPYQDIFFHRPALSYVKPLAQLPSVQLPIQELPPQYPDNPAAYSHGNYGKKRKPKPFSVMLDIYPITDLSDQPPSNKVSRPRLPNAPLDEYDPRRPLSYNRGQRHYPTPQGSAIPLVAVPASQAGITDEDERQQMIFHLNLYPRNKKTKYNRNDIIQRSAMMQPEDQEKFMHSVMSPFNAITKQLTDHSAIEESKYEESDLPESSTELPSTDQQPNFLEMENETIAAEAEEISESPSITESNEEHEPTEKMESEKGLNNSNFDRRGPIECANCQETNGTEKKPTDPSKDIDTPEGFQAFADGLSKGD